MAIEAAQNTFLWQGIDKNGRKARGAIQGTSQATVRVRLHKQGIKTLKVRRQPRALFRSRIQKIGAADIALFTRQLATMTKSGIPLVQSFEIVGESLENSSMRQLVLNIKDDVESGNNFADSIRKHPRYFDELFCNLIAVGEQSGALETMLERLAAYREQSEVLKAKIKKAMTYPIAVIVIAVVVTAILLIKVVPQFAGIFSSFGAELPAFTLFVLGLSDWTIANWWIVLAATGTFAVTLRQASRRSKAFREAVDKTRLRLPVIGPITKNSCYARFSRTLATTFAAGVPLADALEAVAGTTGNEVYANATRRIRDDVTSGQQLSFSIRNTALFPAMIVQLIGIGEESGALDAMLDSCASYYEAEVDNAIDGLIALMEPMIMAVLGTLVGGLMIAMYLPIFQLGSVM